jgi:hypothetical protein
MPESVDSRRSNSPGWRYSDDGASAQPIVVSYRELASQPAGGSEPLIDCLAQGLSSGRVEVSLRCCGLSEAFPPYGRIGSGGI